MHLVGKNIDIIREAVKSLYCVSQLDLFCQQRKLSARSDRVKCVDVHPTEPWMLASLYNGNVHVWNYESQTLVKTFEVTDLPGRIFDCLRASSYESGNQADLGSGTNVF